jgi:hypothetical protein
VDQLEAAFTGRTLRRLTAATPQITSLIERRRPSARR